MSTKSSSSSASAKKKLPSSDLQALTKEIRSLKNEVYDFKGKLESVSLALTNCNEQLEDIILRLNKSEERYQQLEERHDADTRSLKNKISLLEDQLNNQAQEILKNEVEVIGIPEQSNENLLHLALVAATKLGVELKEGDIDWVQRAGPKRTPAVAVPNNEATSQLPRPIVVRLLRRAKRDDLLRAAKTRKSITTEDFGIGNKHTRIYFNERLTKENRLLFRDCRKKAALAGYRYCWTNNGSIFIRKHDGRPAIRIRNSDELQGKIAGADNN